MELDYSEKLMTTQHFDLELVPDTPNRRAHHRRAQSETFIRFPSFDDDSFLDDAVFDFSDAPSLSSDNNYNPLLQQQPAINGLGIAQEQAQSMKSIEKTHFRSLSVDANFFEGLNFGPSSSSSADGGGGGGVTASGGPLDGPRHRYSSSMDGSAAASTVMSSFEAMMVDPSKKATGADRLQELALIDPKRAKRILSNRQSAARSKERKVQYTSELERKVQTLQTEATTLSAQVTVLQRDTTGLTNENKELKMRLQALDQQAHLRDALNETLREEVQRLKRAAGQIPSANGNNFSSGPGHQYSYQQHSFLNYGGNHVEHHQHHHQQQIRAQHSNQNISEFNTQLKPSFADFNQKV